MDELIKTIEYRGYKAEIYHDDYGQQFYAKVDGEEFYFGSFNFEYEDDLKYLIDRKLDFIYDFSEYGFSEAGLSFFNNSHWRDIKLTYRNRIIKVFLVDEIDEISALSIKDLRGTEILGRIITESLQLIKKFSENNC